MDYTPHIWKTVDGQKCLVVQDILCVTGDQKHFTESEKRQILRILDSRDDMSWEQLIIRAEEEGLGRLRVHAIVDYLLTVGELCEPSMGWLALTYKARIGGAI